MIGSHVLNQNTVRFTFPPSRMGRVAVAGDFSGWEPIDLQQTDSGEYALEIAGLPAGDISYKFLTPTGWAYDPRNYRRTADGLNNVLSLGGQRGELQYRRFFSRNLLSDVDYLTYLPPSYALDGQRAYPMLLLLGTLLEESTDWVDRVSIHETLDELMAGGIIQPMIVVMPGKDAYSTDVEPWVAHLEYLTRDLIDHIEAEYRTLGLHAAEGIELGGIWALRAGLTAPERFCSVGCLSASVPNWLRGVAVKQAERVRTAGTRFRFACGSDDAEMLENNGAFQAHLENIGIQAEFAPNDGERGWPLWTRLLTYSLGFHDFSFRSRW